MLFANGGPSLTSVLESVSEPLFLSLKRTALICTAAERYTAIFQELGGDDAVAKYSAEAALPVKKALVRASPARKSTFSIRKIAQHIVLDQLSKRGLTIFFKPPTELPQHAIPISNTRYNAAIGIGIVSGNLKVKSNQ